ncbi:MAG TPA: RDD family protein, partial [Pilimelia sp.]|nr:RDD family protein [Pilimelia sp.]
PPPGPPPSPQPGPPSGAHPGMPPGPYPMAPPPGGQQPAGPPGWVLQSYRYPTLPPAPRPHGFALASPGARLAARLLDIGVLLLLNAIANGWFVWQYAMEVAPTLEPWRRYLTGATSEAPPQGTARSGYLQVVILLIAAALWLAYEVPAVANTGQTLGKRALGLRVVRLDDPGPIGMGRSLRRWRLVGLPTVLWTCCGLGLLIQLVDSAFLLVDHPNRQALHDKMARTVVVRIPRGAPPAGPHRAGDDPDRPPPAGSDRPGGTR